MNIIDIDPVILGEILDRSEELPNLEDGPEKWAYLKNDTKSNYFVSNYGRVYDHINKRICEIETENFRSDGPIQIACLKRPGYEIRCMLNYLIAYTFVDRPMLPSNEDIETMTLPQYIRHIDGNPLNCRASNLKWVL